MTQSQQLFSTVMHSTSCYNHQHVHSTQNDTITQTTTRRGFIEQKQHLRIRSQQCQTDRGKAMGLGVAGVSSPFL